MLIQVTHANPSHANPSHANPRHANPSQCEKGAVTQVRINFVTVGNLVKLMEFFGRCIAHLDCF